MEVVVLSEIVRPSDEEHFEILERLDEEQVRSEIQGVFVRDMVYQFKDSKGRQVTGLSYAGVKELLRFMVRHGYDIRFEAAILEEHEKEYRSKCRVIYTAPNGKQLEMWGYSRQLKHWPSGELNEFAYVQACSKAQRNAGRAIIPERAATRMLEIFLERGQVRGVSAEEVSGLGKPVPIPKGAEPVKVEAPPRPEVSAPREYVVKWTVDGEELPFDSQSTIYNRMVKRVMNELSTEQNVAWSEEKVENYITEIHAIGEISEGARNRFNGALAFAIARHFGVPDAEWRNRVKVTWT